MASDERDGKGETRGDEARPSTPFDNPYFLPALCWIFALWFGYDGWFNPEMEWVKFNRYGFAFWIVVGSWFTYKAVLEKRADAEKGSAGE